MDPLNLQIDLIKKRQHRGVKTQTNCIKISYFRLMEQTEQIKDGQCFVAKEKIASVGIGKY